MIINCDKCNRLMQSLYAYFVSLGTVTKRYCCDCYVTFGIDELTNQIRKENKNAVNPLCGCGSCIQCIIAQGSEQIVNAIQARENNTMVLVKVAPMGEVVTEVNLEAGSTVGQALETAGVDVNGRAITVNNAPATEQTVVSENAVISLANKMKGGVR